MAASATLALKPGVWFRRGRLLIISPDSLGTACPLSGRNSTYRLVQILEAGSDLGIIARHIACGHSVAGGKRNELPTLAEKEWTAANEQRADARLASIGRRIVILTAASEREFAPRPRRERPRRRRTAEQLPVQNPTKYAP